jgi:hyperosmotically inducible protein
MQKRAVHKFVVLLVCLVVAAGAACKSGPDDATITGSVKSKMAADTNVSATSINVDTKEGVVTLSGTVDSATEKSQAETIAKGVEGVKSVTNNLTVKPAAPVTTSAPSASDTAIENAIMANLTKAGVSGVEVDVMNGEATLKGSVTRDQMMKAVQAANEASPKPSKVNNQLTAK